MSNNCETKLKIYNIMSALKKIRGRTNYLRTLIYINCDLFTNESRDKSRKY